MSPINQSRGRLEAYNAIRMAAIGSLGNKGTGLDRTKTITPEMLANLVIAQ
jgi:hypothetical protein